MHSRFTLQEVQELARQALISSGGGEQQSAVVAQSIAEAEAQGIRNVGLAYLPTYCAHLRCGSSGVMTCRRVLRVAGVTAA